MGSELRVCVGGQWAEGTGLQQLPLGVGKAEEAVLCWGGDEVRVERDGAGLIWISTRKAQQKMAS